MLQTITGTLTARGCQRITECSKTLHTEQAWARKSYTQPTGTVPRHVAIFQSGAHVVSCSLIYPMIPCFQMHRTWINPKLVQYMSGAYLDSK